VTGVMFGFTASVLAMRRPMKQQRTQQKGNDLKENGFALDAINRLTSIPPSLLFCGIYNSLLFLGCTLTYDTYVLNKDD
jgi:MFS superfamily sulfate permease-like transporter